MTIATTTELICFLVLSAVVVIGALGVVLLSNCLLYTSPSPRDVEESRMPSSA